MAMPTAALLMAAPAGRHRKRAKFPAASCHRQRLAETDIEIAHGVDGKIGAQHKF